MWVGGRHTTFSCFILALIKYTKLDGSCQIQPQSVQVLLWAAILLIMPLHSLQIQFEIFSFLLSPFCFHILSICSREKWSLKTNRFSYLAASNRELKWKPHRSWLITNGKMGNKSTPESVFVFRVSWSSEQELNCFIDIKKRTNRFVGIGVTHENRLFKLKCKILWKWMFVGARKFY